MPRALWRGADHEGEAGAALHVHVFECPPTPIDVDDGALTHPVVPDTPIVHFGLARNLDPGGWQFLMSEVPLYQGLVPGWSAEGGSRRNGWWFRTKAKAVQDGFRTHRKPRRVPPPPLSISSQRPMTVASVSVSLGHTSTRPNRCTYPDATRN